MKFLRLMQTTLVLFIFTATSALAAAHHNRVLAFLAKSDVIAAKNHL